MIDIKKITDDIPGNLFTRLPPFPRPPLPGEKDISSKSKL